jgi:hypothetical protein
MALVNPNIAMSFRQPDIQAPNALAQFAQIQQIQGGRQAQELNALKMQEAQAAMEERNALRQLNPANADYENQLFRLNPQLGIAYRKERTAAETAAIDQQSKSTKLLADKLALLPEAYKRADTPEAYLQLHQSVHADPVIGPWLNSVGATPEKGLANLQNAVQTGKFDDLRLKSMQSVSQILDSMKPQVVAPGSTLVQGGKPVFTAPERQDTDLIRNFNAAKAQGFTGTIFDYERKIKEAGRTPAQAPAPTIAQIVDPKNPNQMITIDARRYQGGGVGSPGVLGVGGKEPSAAVRENKAELGKTQLADDLDNLRASFTTLDQMRAIPSTERNALSNIASATAATGLGQMAGRAVGTEAQVEREVINSARTRLVNSIKNATGMSAQQLNSNVELQTMLKSISDPGQPIQAALRIIDDIDNAYVKGAGMPKKGTPAAGGKPAANVITNPQFPGFSIGKP